MGGGAPLLFYSHATCIVARPAGLHALLRTPRSAAVAMRLIEEWAHVMESHGCLIVRDVGDVLVAVCGVLTRCERHAERACAAALAAAKAVRELSEELGVQLGLRVGVHTARCVGGAVGATRSCFSVWGEAATHADRLQRLAPLHGVLVSQKVLDATLAAVQLGKQGAVKRVMLDFAPNPKGGADDVYTVSSLQDPRKSPR